MYCSKRYYLNEGHTCNEWKIFTHYTMHWDWEVYPENWNIQKKKNYCHLHTSGMCFPVKVSVFICVCVYVCGKYAPKWRENNQFFYGDAHTERASEQAREREGEKNKGKKNKTKVTHRP